MPNISIAILHSPRKRALLGCLALAMMLAALTGCVTGGSIKPSPKAQAPAAPEGEAATQGEAMIRLDNGRYGFVITENPKMDKTARDDFQRAVALLNEGKDAQAIELLEKVIQQSPGVTAPYINLALAYERTGKLEKAEAQLKTALSLVPDHPVACNQYGLLCRKAGRFEEARTMYEKALARYPEYYPAHRNLGILCDIYLNDAAEDGNEFCKDEHSFLLKERILQST